MYNQNLVHYKYWQLPSLLRLMERWLKLDPVQYDWNVLIQPGTNLLHVDAGKSAPNEIRICIYS